MIPVRSQLFFNNLPRNLHVILHIIHDIIVDYIIWAFQFPIVIYDDLC